MIIYVTRRKTRTMVLKRFFQGGGKYIFAFVGELNTRSHNNSHVAISVDVVLMGCGLNYYRVYGKIRVVLKDSQTLKTTTHVCPRLLFTYPRGKRTDGHVKG